MDKKGLFRDHKVTFNPDIKISTMDLWAFAYYEARKSNWQQIVADRNRFQRRINQTGKIISPVLNAEHRKIVAAKIN